MSVNPYQPGTADYYRYQVQASQKSREQQLQEQARQKVAYEAYQAANKEAQQKALETKQQQTLTPQAVAAKQQEILDTRYSAGSRTTQGPNGEQMTETFYSIPVRDKAAEAQALRQNYAKYQQQNLQLQRQSIAAQNAAQQAARVNEGYSLFVTRQIAEARGGPTAYSNNSPYRGSIRYDVQLGNAPRAYQVNLEDRLSGGPFHYARSPGETAQIRTEEARLAVSKPTGNPIQDAAFAFAGKLENVGKSVGLAITDLFGGRQIPRTTYDEKGNVVSQKGTYAPNPEVEAAAYTAATSGKASSLKTGFTLINAQSIQEFGKIGEEIKENPAAAIGSLGASALFAYSTSGSAVNKAAAVVQTAKTASTASKAAQIAQQAAAEAKAGAATTRAVMFTPEGDVIPLTEVRPGIVRAPVRQIPGVGFGYTEVTLPGASAPRPVPAITKSGTTVEKITVGKSYVIENAQGEDIGFINAQTRKVTLYSNEGVSQEQTAALVAGKPSETTPAESVASIISYPQEEGGKQIGQIVRIDAGTVSRSPVIEAPKDFVNPVRGPVKVVGAPAARDLMSGIGTPSRTMPQGTAVTYKTDALLQTAKDATKRAAQVERANVALGQAQEQARPMQSFFKIKTQSEKAAQSSNTALQTVNEYAFDRSLQESARKALNFSGSESRAGASESAKPVFVLKSSTYGKNTQSIGFGGETGAERSKSKSQNVGLTEEEAVIISTYPPGSKQSQSQPSKPVFELRNNPEQAGRENNRVNLTTFVGTKPKEDQGTKPKPLSGQKSEPVFKIITNPEQTPFEATRQQPQSSFGFDTPTPTKTVTITQPPRRRIPFGIPGKNEKEKDSGKSSRLGYTKGKNLGVVNIAARSLSLAKGGKFAKSSSSGGSGRKKGRGFNPF